MNIKLLLYSWRSKWVKMQMATEATFQQTKLASSLEVMRLCDCVCVYVCEYYWEWECECECECKCEFECESECALVFNRKASEIHLC